MSRTSLRDLLRAHYGHEALPRETIAAWIAAERDTGARRASGTAQRLRWVLMGLGAAALLALVATIARRLATGEPDLACAIATEVAANHAKSRPLDVEATTFVELRRGMDRFDFMLVEPSDPICSELLLVGARYCSIQGRAAAQIRLRDHRGDSYTLYETRDDAAFARIGRSEVTVDGSIVRIWRADGLLFALARAVR